jgi:hypothetical protein
MRNDVTAWSLFFGNAVQGLLAAKSDVADSGLEELFDTADRIAEAMVRFKQAKENVHGSTGHETDP